MAVRKIIHIDEELCDGCGLCVPSCAEGAIQIVDGKARLIGENLCDGLGACLGDCPNDALKVEEREAEEFDEAAVEQHLEQQQPPPAPEPIHTGCPSSRAMNLRPDPAPRPRAAGPGESALGHWPVKLRLVPPSAPFLRDADLLLVADCVPFASPDLHQELLPGKAVVIGCPKFDDDREGVERLAAILRHGGVRSLTVVHMEVPCCFGYWKMGEDAIEASGRDIPLDQVIVGVKGELRRPGADEPILPRMVARRPDA